MAPVPLLVFFALFNPLLVCASKDGLAFNRRLPFNCGKLGEIGFPFTNNTSPETCGPCVVDGCDEKSQRIQLVRGGKWFELHSISQAGCNNFSIYYTRNTSLPSPPPTCSILQLPVNNTESYGDIFRLLTATFSIEVLVTPFCYRCYLQRGECQIIEGQSKCIHSIKDMSTIIFHSLENKTRFPIPQH
ncbi:hypothetical protein BDE02_10G107500 [Populus trichocarpa]|nr:hypothetical protein BDE02_10G107500 [Populus trichocarpa]